MYEDMGHPVISGRPFNDLTGLLPLSTRAARVLTNRLAGMLLSSTASWQYRSGWSATIADWQKIIPIADLQLSLVTRELPPLIRVVVPELPRGFHWVDRLFVWAANRALRNLLRQFRSRNDSLAAWLGGLEYLPETDPRWNHLLWLRTVEDDLANVETRLRCGDMDSKKVAGQAAVAFAIKADRSKTSADEVRTAKLLGAKIAVLFTTTVPLIFIAPFIRALLPVLG